MRDDNVIRLRHMLGASRKAIKFFENRVRRYLTDGGRLLLPDIPWSDIISMCHRLVHAYFDVNLDIIWETVNHDLPSLVLLLEQALLVED